VAEQFDPAHVAKLENPERLVELPPANLVKLLELRGAETVVDYGAGTGMYTLPLAAALPHGTVLAVDVQDVLLERLRGKLEAEPSGGRVQTVLVTDAQVPLDDGVADRVLMLNVLHHIYDQPEALSELVRLLAPAGLLVSVEFARMHRPVGPPNDHVLPFEEVRALIRGLGLEEQAAYEPGEIGRYHNAVVARKPAP